MYRSHVIHKEARARGEVGHHPGTGRSGSGTWRREVGERSLKHGSYGAEISWTGIVWHSLCHAVVRLLVPVRRQGRPRSRWHADGGGGGPSTHAAASTDHVGSIGGCCCCVSCQTCWSFCATCPLAGVAWLPTPAARRHSFSRPTCCSLSPWCLAFTRDSLKVLGRAGEVREAGGVVC